MEHQDWNNITFHNASAKKKLDESKKKLSNKKNDNPENVRLEPPKQLGQLISSARTATKKNQKELANLLGISVQILARWESNKEIPNNAQIANIEKKLGVKLPRCKKVSAKDI